jgi:hypothetical protein
VNLTSLCLYPASGWAVDPKLLPEKTEIIVKVNIKQVLESELARSKNVQDVVAELKGAFNQLPGNDLAFKYLEKMGLDPAKDLTSVTLAHPANQDAEDMFLVVEGKFNLAKIEAAARDAAKEFGQPLTITKHNDIAVLEFNPAAGGVGVFVGLIGTKTILAAGNLPSLKEAIARSAGTKPAVLKKDVADLLKLVNEKQSISFVASGRSLGGLGQGFGAIGQAMPGLEGGISGSISFTKQLEFQVGVAMNDPIKARDTSDQGNNVLFIARAIVAQQAQQNAQFAPVMEVLNSIRVFTMGNNVMMTGEVSYDALEQLFKSLAGQLKGQ